MRPWNPFTFKIFPWTLLDPQHMLIQWYNGIWFLISTIMPHAMLHMQGRIHDFRTRDQISKAPLLLTKVEEAWAVSYPSPDSGSKYRSWCLLAGILTGTKNQLIVRHGLGGMLRLGQDSDVVPGLGPTRS